MAKKRYTLAEIEAMDREFLTPEIVGGCLGWDPYSINLQVKADPSRLGFPTMMCGTRVTIPKEGFVRFCKGIRETYVTKDITVHHIIQSGENKPFDSESVIARTKAEVQAAIDDDSPRQPVRDLSKVPVLEAST